MSNSFNPLTTEFESDSEGKKHDVGDMEEIMPNKWKPIMSQNNAELDFQSNWLLYYTNICPSNHPDDKLLQNHDSIRLRRLVFLTKAKCISLIKIRMKPSTSLSLFPPPPKQKRKGKISLFQYVQTKRTDVYEITLFMPNQSYILHHF